MSKLHYDSLPYKILYFLCPRFRFEWACLIGKFSELCLVVVLHISFKLGGCVSVSKPYFWISRELGGVRHCQDGKGGSPPH